jgi:protein phosphatase 1L
MDLKTFLDDQKKKNGKENGEQGPPLPLQTAINIMVQIAEAMNYLHKSGVMHRDLKASNVLINIGEGQDDSSLSVKLADFGLSKLKLHDSKFTTKMVGTTRWRAPEAFEDEANIEKYRKSADVYSFALVFFEVLIGEIPFEGIPLTNVLRCIRNGMRPHLPPVEYCPGYLSALIEKCWATDPAERPQFPEISQLLACCKNLILMHSSPSPRNFFMHFDVTRRGPPHLQNLFYRFNNFGSRISGNPSVSGWGVSEDFKFSFGLASCCVSKATFQEFDANGIAKVANTVIGCFGVFGTHPGSRLAKRFLGLLFHDLLKHPHFFHDPKLAIVETYKKIDQDNWGEEKSQQHAARSTACMYVLVGDQLLVANVGDSTAVICTHGEAIALSTNHTLYQAQIGNPGGVVRYNHWIIRGGFVVSCACGVQQLEQYLVTEPEIHEVKIEEGVAFLVLATAGLWSVVSNQDAVSLVQSIPDAEEAANRLVEEAHRRGSPDNVTCVIVHFHHDA